MKSILRLIMDNENKSEPDFMQPGSKSPGYNSDRSRRNFLKKAAIGGIAMGGFMNIPVADAVARVTSNVQRASGPSDLKITDMRVAVIAEGGRKPIIRIDTNQGIYGLGEVRDSGDERYALFLKSRILQFKKCRQ